jgi:hypothetical protein
MPPANHFGKVFSAPAELNPFLIDGSKGGVNFNIYDKTTATDAGALLRSVQNWFCFLNPPACGTPFF